MLLFEIVFCIQQNDAEAVLVRDGCVFIGYDHPKGNKSINQSIKNQLNQFLKMYYLSKNIHFTFEYFQISEPGWETPLWSLLLTAISTRYIKRKDDIDQRRRHCSRKTKLIKKTILIKQDDIDQIRRHWSNMTTFKQKTAG